MADIIHASAWSKQLKLKNDAVFKTTLQSYDTPRMDSAAND